MRARGAEGDAALLLVGERTQRALAVEGLPLQLFVQKHLLELREGVCFERFERARGIIAPRAPRALVLLRVD